MALKRAVFWDKDGTLVEDVPYNVSPEKVRFAPDVFRAMRMLQAEGYALVVATNQPGIAHGYFDEKGLTALREHLLSAFLKERVAIDGFYYCPHHPQGNDPRYSVPCRCRKPEPGLLLQAAHDLGIALQDSWMVGDILHDVECGNRAGCRSLLLDNGNETEWKSGPLRVPFATVRTPVEAALRILRADREHRFRSIADYA